MTSSNIRSIRSWCSGIRSSLPGCAVCAPGRVFAVGDDADQPIACRAVKAQQIVELSGPDSALSLVDVPEPEASHMLTPGSGVVVEVHAAGVSFPEVLQTRGEYQFKPPVPFVPGAEVAGIVRSAPAGAPVREGDRVAAFCALGAFAQVAVAPEFLAFPLAEALDF